MKAEFLKSIDNYKDALTNIPQFFIMGRSNVGKSSFINSLTNRKDLARTSKTPGKTTTLNYYIIDNKYYLVDSPGYGYAKRTKEQKAKFIKMIVDFLNYSNVKLVFLLIDFLVGPTIDDFEVKELLEANHINYICVLNKYDKVQKTKRYKREKELQTQINHDYIVYSAREKMNIDKILSTINMCIGGDYE